LATEIVDRGFRVTIDLVVKVGLLRYRDHCQLEEIQAFLKCSSARIDLPITTIGIIAKRFLEYCKFLHKKYEYKIKEDIKSNGGYVANFDGTTEKKSGVINFVVMDSLSGHILASEMIASESSAEVTRILKTIKSKYGIPLTTVSDLKPGFLSASEDSFEKKSPHKFCDYHFLGTFKNDFKKDHSFIKARLTKTWKITSGLRNQLKSMETSTGKKSKNPNYKNLNEIEKHWADSKNVLETHRLIVLWILSFKKSSSGKGLPFDLPYLDLYERLIQGKKLVDTIFKEADAKAKEYYCNFNFFINKMDSSSYWSPKFSRAVNNLKFSRKWFNKLRGTLLLGALKDKEDPLAPLSKRYQLTEEEAKTIPKNIKSFLTDIENRISSCKNPDKLKFLMRLRDQTKKYQDNLRLPVIVVTIDRVSKIIIPTRTNNCMESFFRLIKALLRRNTGRSALTKEFSSVGDLLPYYISMKNHKTFKLIFEDEKKLIEEFAMIIKNKRNIEFNNLACDLQLLVNNKKTDDYLKITRFPEWALQNVTNPGRAPQNPAVIGKDDKIDTSKFFFRKVPFSDIFSAALKIIGGVGYRFGHC